MNLRGEEKVKITNYFLLNTYYMPGGDGRRKPPGEREGQDKLEGTKQKLLKRDGWEGN